MSDTLCLTLETSTEVASVALMRGAEAIAWSSHKGAASVSEWLLPTISRLLAEVGVEKAQAVACGRGPGAFTGVRTACATAQALAWGWGVPLYAVGSLEALLVAELGTASPRPREAEVAFAVLMDARQGELYAAAWGVNAGAGRRLLVAPELVARHDASAWCERHGIQCAIGTGAAEAAERVEVLDAWREPRLREQALARLALGVGCIAAELHERGEATNPLTLEPSYVRNRVALTEAERRGQHSARFAGLGA
ncbi:MAG: tRNA (adenosine(37)-N6)-threonylcarbamoyltransferase complex dimerization subunit type 1 TsaB [Casimicrobiaceae bacterium]|nr:tRNA (adenosine(37)-N6)-threonylcarbamoyltransferase complex dimerization subunit type 1 TsaB [Casimicrobiaceae bacterium]MCX8099532.1 tRNA (adenosine(37)-N6)-threonylcarbamoyltransferase complex dimerization subunit type 1 TsaB [Casimicrobiaceae bacterium]MDW8311399.1 tRNA (adenosine(37)-N6)-threonylcarbamoyltransferase complex dimerization subunit type 1 TsaB [Burkholderiales bacterium]